MKLAIMQPYFFPYIGFFQLMDAADKIILYDYVHFIKNGWIKRNRILEKNKGDIWIQVPVSDASSNRKIYEMEIDAKSCWQKKIVNLLEHNYKNVPYYHEIMPHLWPIFNKQYTHLSELNFESIRVIKDLLEIQVVIEYGSQRFLDIEAQLLQHDSVLDTKSQRICKICEREQADTYINPIGGMELYNKEQFAGRDITLLFLQTKDYSYKQATDTFIPHLSIIDVLCNCGIEKTKMLLKNYQLI